MTLYNNYEIYFSTMHTNIITQFKPALIILKYISNLKFVDENRSPEGYNKHLISHETIHEISN